MLKLDKVKVTVNGFTVSEIGAEEAVDFRDALKEEHDNVGDQKFLLILTRELFVKRVTRWPLAEACNEENKRIFWEKFAVEAKSIISSAEDKLKKKREELLGNLSAGAGGT